MSVVLVASLLMISCVKQTGLERAETSDFSENFAELPDITVDKSLLDYDNASSQWTLDNQLYSGYAVSYYQSGRLKEKIGFLNGRKQNQATQWFLDGHVKRMSCYHNGKLHGIKKSWSPDKSHVLLSQITYHKGKAHGEQKFWYPTGEIYKILNLNMGAEEGMQQAFRKNGELYANYEAREGRIFGLKKAALCYGLEDESIKYEN